MGLHSQWALGEVKETAACHLSWSAKALGLVDAQVSPDTHTKLGSKPHPLRDYVLGPSRTGSASVTQRVRLGTGWGAEGC